MLIQRSLPETRVNPDVTGEQTVPDITLLNNGNYIITWGSDRQDGSGWDIYGRRFDATGTPLGDPFRLSASAEGNQRYRPTVTATSNGFVVAWSYDTGFGQPSRIFLREFTEDGTALPSDIAVTSTADSAILPVVAALSDGGYVVCFTSYGHAGGVAVIAQRYDSNGIPDGGQTLVHQDFQGYRNYPSVTALENGSKFIVTWAGYDPAPGWSYVAVYGKVYDAAGNVLKETFPINDLSVSNGEELAPTVTELEGGSFVVVWERVWGGIGLYARIFSGPDYEAGPEILITDYLAAYEPHVTQVSNGFVIVWQSYGEDGSAFGIFAQRFDNAGNRIGGKIAVNDTTEGYQAYPRVTELPNKDIVIVWAGNGPDDVSGIYQKIIDFTPATDGNDTLDGTPYVDALEGLAGNDLLSGLADNDRLDGGAGADTMRGGTGNDTYSVDAAGDQVVELNGEGTDLVRASVSYSLSGRYVETLQLTGANDINATGNSYANTLIGNDGDNILTGLAGHDVLDGGVGGDSLTGGTGNDTYYVDSGDDTVTEDAAAGLDEVRSTVRFELGDNVENLLLLGALNLTGKGNGLNNILTGNDGSDTLSGGAGNDTYYIQNAGDRVVETSGQGRDLIISSVTYSLVGRTVEDLTLNGTGNLDATGNSLGNTLVGNDGNNVLNGLAARDVLTGGLGADTFLFEMGSGMDTITDFSAAQNDMINVHAHTGGAANASLVTQAGSAVRITFDSSNIITVSDALRADVLAHMVW